MATIINHNSKRLDEWQKCAERHYDWHKHSYYSIIVDSTEWGAEQIYEDETMHPVEITDAWIESKCKELKHLRHITRAEIILYRKFYQYDQKQHCYCPELIKYKTIRA